MRIYTIKGLDIKRQRHTIDAAGKTLGRMATDVARLLMGKNKPIFTRNIDTGDFVVIINAARVKLTGNKLNGNKLTGKTYTRHSGYPGGLRTVTAKTLMDTRPALVVEKAIRGMLPRNKLGDAMFRKLNVYAEGIPAPVVKAKPAPKPTAKAEPKPATTETKPAAVKAEVKAKPAETKAPEAKAVEAKAQPKIAETKAEAKAEAKPALAEQPTAKEGEKP